MSANTPSRGNRLEMGRDLFALLVQPIGNRQIDRFGAVKQSGFVVHLVILKIRAVLLKIIGQLLFALSGKDPSLFSLISPVYKYSATDCIL